MTATVPELSVPCCTLRHMDDNLATVIPFPVRSAPTGTARQPAPADPAEPADLEDYWARVQRLGAERRRLVGSGAG